MDIKHFFQNYNFHDSLLKNIEYCNDTSSVNMLVDFAFWMQEGYQEEEPETGLILIIFSDVSEYDCPDNINFDQVSFLGSEIIEDAIKYEMVNDFTDEYFSITIKAKSVDVLPQ